MNQLKKVILLIIRWINQLMFLSSPLITQQIWVMQCETDERKARSFVCESGRGWHVALQLQSAAVWELQADPCSSLQSALTSQTSPSDRLQRAKTPQHSERSLARLNGRETPFKLQLIPHITVINIHLFSLRLMWLIKTLGLIYDLHLLKNFLSLEPNLQNSLCAKCGIQKVKGHLNCPSPADILLKFLQGLMLICPVKTFIQSTVCNLKRF